jgi:hypothetical protein
MYNQIYIDYENEPLCESQVGRFLRVFSSTQTKLFLISRVGFEKPKRFEKSAKII